MGLAITRGRLESLYGLKQSLTLRNLKTGGVEARVTMPFNASDATTKEPGKGAYVEFQNAHS
jgi:hypothetical protein